MKRYVFLVIVLAILIYIVIDIGSRPTVHQPAPIINAYETQEVKGGTMKPVTPQHGVPNDQVRVWRVSEIAAHFNDNEVTAERLFAPETYFEGTIERIETNAVSGARVDVHDMWGSGDSLLCDVDEEDVSSLVSLHRGETDFFVGSQARKFIGTVIFNHCKFVNPGR